MAKTRIFVVVPFLGLSSWITLIMGIWGVTRAEEVTNLLRNTRRGHGQAVPPKATPRIINGMDVKELRYPYFSLMYGRSLCGGVLIAPRLVLGAAHCENAADLFRIGPFADVHDGQFVDIRSTIRHPEYEASRLSHDVMIFELEDVADYDYVVLDDRTISEGRFTALGFGDTDEGSILDLAKELQEAEMEYVDNEACDAGHGYSGEVTDDMMCVGGGDKDSCIGDSGGPLIKKGKNMKEDKLVGLVSWGRGCAEEGVPGVYVRISYFYDWIVETVCGNFADEAPAYMQCEGSPVDDPYSAPVDDPYSNWFMFDDRPTRMPSEPRTKEPTYKTESPTIEPTITGEPSVSFFPSEAPSNRTDVPTETPTENPTHTPTIYTPKEALFVSWGGSVLKECQGDCDNDDECEGDLVCYKRNSERTDLPGCTNKELIGMNVDICIKPRFLW